MCGYYGSDNDGSKRVEEINFDALIGKVIKGISVDEDADVHGFKVITDAGDYLVYVKAKAAGDREMPMWLESIDADDVDAIIGKKITAARINKYDNEEESSTSFVLALEFEDGYEMNEWSFQFTLDRFSPVMSINWDFVGIKKV